MLQAKSEKLLGAYLTVALVWVIANALTLVPSGLYGRLAGAVILFCVLPGALIVSRALTLASAVRKAPPWPEVLLLGSAVSYLVTTLIVLLLGYAPRPITYPAVLGICDVIIVALLVVNYRGGLRLWSSVRIDRSRAGYVALVALVLVLLLAAFLRLGNLGFGEYVGDEIDAVYRARQAILGDREELFLQRKGPVQIMVTAAFALGTNSFDELPLRLPFALASVLAVAALYLLGASAWNRRIGLLAAAALAIDGVVVGFTRVVQYGGVVLLTLVAIVYCLHRMSTSISEAAGLRRRYLSLALILLASALLTHYEVAMVVVPMAMLLFREWKRVWAKENLKELSIAVVIALALLLVFYVPFVLHPHFGETTDAYANVQMGLGEGPFNNVGRYVGSSIFYNSVYYVVLAALLWSLGTFAVLSRALPERWRVGAHVAVLLAVAGTALSLVAPESLASEGRSWALACFVPALALAVWFASPKRIEQAMFAWFFTVFVISTFLVKTQHLHFYTMAPAAALVAALGLDWAITKAPLLWMGAGRGVGVAVYALLAGYLYLVFVQTSPQYAVDFPDHRSSLYWTPQSELPPGGFFGFPRRSGWRVVSVLYRQGELRGTYMSNRKLTKPEWAYMREPLKVDEEPRYFFFDESSTRLVSKETYPIEWVEERYDLIGRIRVNGEPRMRIFERKGASGNPPVRDYDAETYDAAYDRVDWLSEYRHDYQLGLREPDVAALRQHLDEQAPALGLVVLNDPVLATALNYYYAGPAASMALPSPWSVTALERAVGSQAQVTLGILAGANEEATAQARSWLTSRYGPGETSTFGNLTAVTFKHLCVPH